MQRIFVTGMAVAGNRKWPKTGREMAKILPKWPKNADIGWAGQDTFECGVGVYGLMVRGENVRPKLTSTVRC